MSPRTLAVTALACVLSFVPGAAGACPFCSQQGQTLTKEVEQAAFVVFGTLSNPRLAANSAGVEAGTTDLIIEDVVKPHPYLKDKKVLVLPRYIPVEKDSKLRFLIFCDYFKERVDPYRGLPTKSNDLAAYLKGAMAVKDKDTPTRLEFFFDYLANTDTEISTDAYKEFANADGKDVAKMLAKESPEHRAKVKAKLVEWLADKDTPSYRYGLYGYMLGLCGSEADAPVLVQLLNDPQRGLISGIDGVLAGYVLLQPKAGWEYVKTVLADSSKDFTRRYAALRAVRFFWEYHPGVVSQKDLLGGVTLLLEQGDIADLAIEDLRKWKQWQLTDKVLSLAGKESHNVPIIHRAILRFALSCQGENRQAAKFVEEQRKRDPERVKDAEELLRLELPPKPAAGGQ